MIWLGFFVPNWKSGGMKHPCSYIAITLCDKLLFSCCLNLIIICLTLFASFSAAVGGARLRRDKIKMPSSLNVENWYFVSGAHTTGTRFWLAESRLPRLLLRLLRLDDLVRDITAMESAFPEATTHTEPGTLVYHRAPPPKKKYTRPREFEKFIPGCF